MNISKPQQRTLHALAQGGAILIERDERGTLLDAECVTREGGRLSDCRDSGPYRMTRQGLLSLRAQLDNRTSGRGW